MGYNIAYTIEQREQGWVQHLSIFQNTPRMMPHPPTVAKIVTDLFGIAPKGPKGVLSEAVAVDHTQLPNGCQTVELFYPFAFPKA